MKVELSEEEIENIKISLAEAVLFCKKELIFSESMDLRVKQHLKSNVGRAKTIFNIFNNKTKLLNKGR